MYLIITKQNCIQCQRCKILLQDTHHITVDKSYVSSNILELSDGNFPIVFQLLGSFDDLEKQILHH